MIKPFTQFLICAFILTSAFTSCKKVVHREVECKQFGLTDENYWFPAHVGDTIRFVNTVNSVKAFVLRDMYINHRNKYTSDTGCGCEDRSSMLLTSANDSMWFVSTINYIENQDGTRYEDLVFVWGGQQSAFYETHRTNLANTIANGETISDVRMYQRDYIESARVKKVLTARNLGLISFETVGGELWTNTNLTSFSASNKSLYNYSENICE